MILQQKLIESIPWFDCLTLRSNIIMKIEQIYTGCLAQGTYYIISEGEAVSIDPLREINPYLERLKKDDVKLKYIFETHFHADFVSGHLDLQKATGAQIVYGPTAKPGFEAHIAKDGEMLNVGKIKIKVLHTPGHTLESVCYLLFSDNEKPYAVFTGDTLFIGDVGRPDLAQKAADMTQEQLAAILYRSLREKLMVLPDEVIVYPAHGAGSACGKSMSKETQSTIGAQKHSNYALRADMDEAEFIKEVTSGLMPPPGYFPANVAMNKNGYDSINEVMERGLNALDAATFENIANRENALVLDTRNASEFSQGFIPNSINIGLDGQFAPWVGALIPDVKQKILIVTEEGKEEETLTRLARVGYDWVIGYLQGGIASWKAAGKELDTVNRISAEKFAAEEGKTDDEIIIDIRRPAEFESGHVAGATNIPLDFINDQISAIPKNKPFYVYCGGGYRSMIASSILKARGWENFKEIEGGFGAISKTNVKKESGQLTL